ncbi:SGNH/GDSL hydrolase family protein [Oribacterium sp. FC2011]|uniref:SGNH/GDSL hydrolase family protein n=1 Tax=Oribacterium sp. FC2011 TaxID=1408311 RepID=UPI0004E21CC4|nr:SGNH/GDSL hydrolase family protein [Oribacterium sp. FC2011]
MSKDEKNNISETTNEPATSAPQESGSGNNSGSTLTKKGSALLAVLILMIVAIIGAFGYMVNTAITEDAIDESVNAERINAANERLQLETDADGNIITKGNGSEAASAVIPEDNSFLNKLSAKEPVSILVIGDVFGTGAGAKDGTNWTDLLASGINESFGSEASVKNLSLPNGNNAYSAYVTLMNEAAGNKDSVYDAVIVALGYYDAPFTFDLQYEGLLRSIKQQYPSAEIIGMIESASLTEPGGYSDETATYARNLLEHYGAIVANMGEAFMVTGEDVNSFTDDGVLPNAEGQKLYANWIVRKINDKLRNPEGIVPDNNTEASTTSTLESDGTIEPVNPDAVLYDHYYYIASDSFQRLDDCNFIISAQELTTLGSETVGMIGLDYDYLTGSNTAQVVIDNTIFGGLSFESEGVSPERHIRIVDNNASINDSIAVSFATKEQADCFHGLIITGNLNFNQPKDKYDELPLPPETTAPETTEAETTVEETTEAETKAKETTAAETTAEETKVPETTAKETKADNDNKKQDETTKETKKASETQAPAKKTAPKQTEAQAAETTAAAAETPAPETSAPETAAAQTAVEETAALPQETVVPETAAIETPESTEQAVISDPADSATITIPTTAYTVEAGQGIDLSQWNNAGPTIGITIAP